MIKLQFFGCPADLALGIHPFPLLLSCERSSAFFGAEAGFPLMSASDIAEVALMVRDLVLMAFQRLLAPSAFDNSPVSHRDAVACVRAIQARVSDGLPFRKIEGLSANLTNLLLSISLEDRSAGAGASLSFGPLQK